MAMTATTATTKLLAAAFAAALLVCGCSQKSAPQHPARPTAQQSAAAAKELRSGVASYRAGAYRTALAHFNRALALNRTGTNARFDRAIVEEQLRSYAHAAADLRALVRAHPKWREARLRLAVVQYRMHAFASAASNFDIALRSNEKNSKVWLDDGVSRFRMKQYTLARRDFERALALAPRSGRAHYWLGLAYLHSGKQYTIKSRNELALAAHSRDPVVRAAARRELTAKRA